MVIPVDDPRAVAAVAAIHAGDLDALRALLADDPGLATARLGDEGDDGMTRTLLHVVTDWPGHVPNGPACVQMLVDAGADPNARFTGPHTETPLHWAASSDDVGVLDALLDAGADIDADGAVIAGGTPLSDATAFGQWDAARRLVERGARVGPWEAAAMGMTDHLVVLLDADPPDQERLHGLLWGACHGGHLATAKVLVERGADPAWVGWDDLTPEGAAARGGWDDVVAWLRSIG